MVDISKIKAGDKITAEITVDSTWDGIGFKSKLSEELKTRSYFSNHEIIAHTPAPEVIEVDDKVTCIEQHGREYVVFAKIGPYAWCGELATVAHPNPAVRPVCFDLVKLTKA